MMGFSYHFRTHAIPALRPIVAGQALAVAAGSIEFHEAVRAIWAAARNKGAMYLPDETFGELRDWILTTLSAEIDCIEEAEATGGA